MPSRLPACAILLCALLLASRVWACDALVGDYSARPGKPAMLRIEKTAKGAFTARVRDDDGNWSREAVPAKDASKDVVSLAKAECALSTPYGALIKAPVGGTYRFGIEAGQSTAVHLAKTGYLLIILGAFQEDGADLYRTASKGAPPPAAPPPPDPTAGQEVQGAPACPGGKRPDMTQASFDALPAGVREGFRSHPPEWRNAFLCGQYLSSLMSQDAPAEDAKADAGSKADRKADFAQIAQLLSAGQVPRTADGMENWWPAAADFLLHNRPTSHKQAIPLRDDGYGLFTKTIMPRLPYPASEDLAGYPSEVEKFVAEAAHMPETQAVFTLEYLRRMGVLTMRPTPDADMIAARILWAALAGDVSDKAFAMIATAAGPIATRDPDLLRREIDDGNLLGVRRLLALGADPTPADMLVLARDGGSPQMYELIHKAVGAYKPPKTK